MEPPRDQETRSYRSHAPERPWRTAASHSNISRSSTTGLALLTATCGPKVCTTSAGDKSPGFTSAGEERG